MHMVSDITSQANGTLGVRAANNHQQMMAAVLATPAWSIAADKISEYHAVLATLSVKHPEAAREIAQRNENVLTFPLTAGRRSIVRGAGGPTFLRASSSRPPMPGAPKPTIRLTAICRRTARAKRLSTVARRSKVDCTNAPTAVASAIASAASSATIPSPASKLMPAWPAWRRSSSPRLACSWAARAARLPRKPLRGRAAR